MLLCVVVGRNMVTKGERGGSVPVDTVGGCWSSYLLRFEAMCVFRNVKKNRTHQGAEATKPPKT